MAATDLTTLATLKLWLPINSTNTNDDATISRLITAVSGDFTHSADRPDLLKTSYTEVRQGDGSPQMVLYHWPITKITTLTVGATTIAASADKVAEGWYVDSDIDPERVWNLWLAGGLSFADGQVIKIAYSAGYVQPGQTPEGGDIPLPEDIEQAIIDWCTYRYNERPNISATARHSSDGDSVQAPLIDAPPNVLKVVERYKRTMPSLDRRQDERDLRMKTNYQYTTASSRK
jgi:hypothetical protein